MGASLYSTPGLLGASGLSHQFNFRGKSVRLPDSIDLRKQRMKRALVRVSVAMVVVAGILLAGASRLGGQNTTTAPATDAPKTAEQVFKNIQVLKGTPAEQLE